MESHSSAFTTASSAMPAATATILSVNSSAPKTVHLKSSIASHTSSPSVNSQLNYLYQQQQPRQQQHNNNNMDSSLNSSFFSNCNSNSSSSRSTPPNLVLPPTSASSSLLRQQHQHHHHHNQPQMLLQQQKQPHSNAVESLDGLISANGISSSSATPSAQRQHQPQQQQQARRPNKIWGSPFTLPSLQVPIFSGGSSTSTTAGKHLPSGITRVSTSSTANTNSSGVITRPKSENFFPESASSGNNSSSNLNSLLLSASDNCVDDLLSFEPSITSSHSYLPSSDSFKSLQLGHYLTSGEVFGAKPSLLLATAEENQQFSDENLEKLSFSELEEVMVFVQNRFNSRQLLFQRIQQDLANDKVLLDRLYVFSQKFSSQSRPLTPSTSFINNPPLIVQSPPSEDVRTMPPIELAPTLVKSAITAPVEIEEQLVENEVSESVEPEPPTTPVLEQSVSKHPEELVCRKWNKGECYKGSHCNYHHECLTCGGPHPRTKCPSAASDKSLNSADPDNICLKWNSKECNWNDLCHRKHICSNCKGSHRSSDCPTSNVNNNTLNTATKESYDDSICLNWNEGRCRMRERCKREHKCTICNSYDHPAMKCDYPGSVTDPDGDRDSLYGYKLDEVCLNWNSGRCSMSKVQCKRRHKCSFCGSEDHMAVGCPEVPDPASLAEVGVDICWNWNLGGCDDTVYPSGNPNVEVGANCKRIHACTNCKESGHSALHCPQSSQNASSNSADQVKQSANEISRKLSSSANEPRQKLSEICLNWNQNKCRLSDRCKRIHVCSLCNSKSHMAIDCTESSTNSSSSNSNMKNSASQLDSKTREILKLDDVCMNWNNGRCRAGKRCRRFHVCASCFSEKHTRNECSSTKA